MIIIGGGVAGLMAALNAAPYKVTLIDAGGAASALSQGGLAAAVGHGDSVASHIEDTLKAGAGLCDVAAVERIIGAGPELVENLLRLGVRFDRDEQGAVALGLEAAHSHKRILHAAGDATGAELMRALSERVRLTPSVTLMQARVVRLLRDDHGICGVVLSDGQILQTDRVLLATGGIGGLFARTTNPEGAIGFGLMLALDAGARLADLEFIQFHPTALDIAGRVTLPLISEAVRGEGGRFVDEAGAAFMNGGDLAARDVVARKVFLHQAGGHKVFLDARAMGGQFARRFPGIHARCLEVGIDPVLQPIPVTPAVHYHMGGVAVEANGETNVKGLFAAGEVARTGLHGANRLASNSLLEAAVFGAVVGREMVGREARALSVPSDVRPLPCPDVAAVRGLMSGHLGVVRSRAGMSRALADFEAMPGNPAAFLCGEIARAALARTDSVGAHALDEKIYERSAA
jgi:L-aspartate oxidase